MRYIDLLLPRYCLRCGRLLPIGTKGICPDCRDELFRESIEHPCRCCGRELISEIEICRSCKERYSEVPAFGRNFPLFAYRKAAKELIIIYKFHNQRDLDQLFAECLWKRIRSAGLEGGCLVPVPCRPAGKRRRGWDPVEAVCRQLERRYGVPFVRLLRRKNGKEQKKMDREGRKENLKRKIRQRKGAISKLPDPDTLLILFDDVYTTGATLSACAESLRAVGYRRICSISLVVD